MSVYIGETTELTQVSRPDGGRATQTLPYNGYTAREALRKLFATVNLPIPPARGEKTVGLVSGSERENAAGIGADASAEMEGAAAVSAEKELAQTS